ncbi:hypothetical protein Aca07nite_71690 [Actinoplanes capillaceus]|uniref:Rieske domain-containing protein n=1 Tax=Actinoplanes campanulatus TaxID=113559 RepID=A0ABQ3WUG6_9ACTN|nr:Rieske (2Fe-2S) protein [Actinoplanes capillaceus]GID49894.1 hypothetical protein Aca07nite_71690 [Actinoplanes capillaceus]
MGVSIVGCTSGAPAVPEPGAAGAGGIDAQILAQTADIPVGGGVTVGNVLLVQPAAGTFRAYSIACPHRGARVSPPDNGIITCWEHNSTFAAEDGSRIDGPAAHGLTQVPITVNGTDVLSS